MTGKIAYGTTENAITGTKMNTGFKNTVKLSSTLHQDNNDRGITRFNVTIS